MQVNYADEDSFPFKLIKAQLISKVTLTRSNQEKHNSDQMLSLKYIFLIINRNGIFLLSCIWGGQSILYHCHCNRDCGLVSVLFQDAELLKGTN